MSKETLCVDKFTGDLYWSISLATAITVILISGLGILTTPSILKRILAFVLVFSTYASFARLMLICVRLVLANMAKEKMLDEGCTCQVCGRKYRVDWLVPDDLWDQIKPEGKLEGAGMLCGSCIAERVELLGNFEAIHCAREVKDDGRRAFAWATMIQGRPVLRYIKAAPPCNNGEFNVGLFGLQLCIGWHRGKPCT